MSNHVSSLFFEVDSFYIKYHTKTIIVPLHINTIQLRVGHLISQLNNISKLPIIMSSRSRLKFVNGSLHDLTHLHHEMRNLLELLKSRQIQKDFSKRSTIKNLISSSFEILSPLGKIPFLQKAGQMLVDALKMDWGMTPKLSAEFHTIISKFHGNISTLRDQLMEQRRDIKKLELDKNFLKLEIKARYLTRRARNFLENIQELIVNNKLPLGIVQKGKLEESLKYLSQKLPPGDRLGVSDIKGLLDAPAMLLLKDEHHFIALLVPIFRKSDQRKSYQLKNEYILVDGEAGMKTAIITNIDRKKKFFLQKTAANEVLTLIHQESCHLFSENFRVCEPIKTEKLGSSSCLPEIFFKEIITPSKCGVKFANNPYNVEVLSPDIAILVTEMGATIKSECLQISSTAMKVNGLTKLMDRKCRYKIAISSKRYEVQLGGRGKSPKIIEFSLPAPRIRESTNISFVDNHIFNVSSITNSFFLLIIFAYLIIRCILIKSCKFAPLG